MPIGAIKFQIAFLQILNEISGELKNSLNFSQNEKQEKFNQNICPKNSITKLRFRWARKICIFALVDHKIHYYLTGAPRLEILLNYWEMWISEWINKRRHKRNFLNSRFLKKTNKVWLIAGWGMICVIIIIELLWLIDHWFYCILWRNFFKVCVRPCHYPLAK